MKNVKGSWKDKLEYFWMYYKLPVLVTLGVCFFVGYFVHAKLTEKESAFEALLFDIHTNAQEEELSEEFAGYAGIDTDEYEVVISTSLLLSDANSGNYTMASLAKLYTQVGTESLDACMMLESDFENYAEADCFADLRDIFTEQELEQFDQVYTDEDGQILGIYSSSLSKIQEIGGYEDAEGILGIMYNSTHTDEAKAFVEFLSE